MRKVMVVFLLTLVVPVLAGADLTIKEKTEVDGAMGMWVSHGTETTYIKDGKYRSESQVERAGVVDPIPIENPPPRVNIVDQNDGTVWRLNLKDKTYQEISSADFQAEYEGDGRYKITDLQVEPTGETRDIAGRLCRGVTVKATFELDKGDEVTNRKADLVFWMAEDSKGLEEMTTFWQTSLKFAQGMDQRVPIWDVLTKLRQEDDGFKGTPLGVDFTVETWLTGEERANRAESIKKALAARVGEKEADAMVNPDIDTRITREVVSITPGKVDDALFRVPGGFRKAARIRVW